MAGIIHLKIDNGRTVAQPAPRHGIPNVEHAPRKGADRGAWSRIFGLIRKLSDDEAADGPVSRIRY